MTDIRNINLNRLSIFVCVIEAGSLSEAAQRTGLAKSAISTHLSRLEAEVGTTLILRNPRHLGLTAAGRQFFEACTAILRQVDDAVTALDRENFDIRGVLRVTTSADFGASVVTPILVSLINQFPGLKVDLIASDQIVDLVGEGIDVAIRLGWPRDSSHTAALLGSFSQWLVAPPSWSDRLARVKKPQNLADWPFIELSILRQPDSWSFTSFDNNVQQVRFDYRLSISTTSAVRAAVMADGGLAVLPDYQVAEDVALGRVVRVLPDWTLPTGGIFAVFPQKRHRSRKVELFLDVIRTKLRHLRNGV
ncbi:LysR family transcriptional regulator [Pseudaminobacter soli (ex Li et al. 2025)]|uniref:LysR family transcriptional regulator n=1 Tax=Pseudaminobacter soli (ex Li et al. 2025) TaxID=1295366 RepID=A0A2P7S1W8_9HYPH|nr:LysR family transcriptional regulator [Mesorhizobium soli]PSJ56475.1 LysR family transcriptional regulator [Mesorhizobium soli]